jgi:hypothetical protein
MLAGIGASDLQEIDPKNAVEDVSMAYTDSHIVAIPQQPWQQANAIPSRVRGFRFTT